MTFIIEYLPLIIFFITYQLYDLVTATTLLLYSTILSVMIAYIKKYKLSNQQIISTTLIIISSSLTYFTGNSNFIKIKPTILYLILATILYYSLKRGNLLIKTFLQNRIEISNEIAIIVTKRTIKYLFTMAILNEIIWRNFSDNFWVNYKLFATTIISLMFIIKQTKYIISNTNQPSEHINTIE